MTRVLALVLLLSVAASAQTTDPRIDVHLLRVENAKLRATLAQLQAEIDTLRLTAERAALVETLRAEQKAPADWVFDWNTRTFHAPPTP